MKKLFLPSVAIFIFSFSAYCQSGQKFASNGNILSSGEFLGSTNLYPLVIKTNNYEWMRITETGNIGIGIIAPTDKLHVAGTARMLNAKVDADLTALNVITQQLNAAVSAVIGDLTLSNGSIVSSSGLIDFGNTALSTSGKIGAMGGISTTKIGAQDIFTAKITTDSISSQLGNINFSNSNLTTSGNISGSNITASGVLQGQTLSVNGNATITGTLDANNILQNGNPLATSQWTTNPADSSISYNGNVFVKNLNATEAISIGSFRFSNGGTVLPVQPGTIDSIHTPFPMTISSGANQIRFDADTLRLGDRIGIDPLPIGGNSRLSVQGDVTATGTISSSVLNSASITTQQLTINGGSVRADTLRANNSLSVNHSLLLAKENMNNFAEVSTIDTAVSLVLQNAPGSAVGIGITPSIGEKLSVAGNVGFSGNLRLTNLSGTGDRVVLVDPNGNLKSGGSSSLICPEWNGCGNSSMDPDALIDPKFVGTTDNFALAFKTNNTEQMRILPNGNIGIGTSAPQHQLHLHSIEAPAVEKFFPLDSSLNFDSLGNSVSLPIQTNPDFKTLQITNNVTGDTELDGLLVGVSGTAAFLDLQEDNQLLIRSKQGLSLITDKGNAVFGTMASGNVRIRSAGNFIISTGTGINSSARLIIKNNGNVGIGTISPSAKLHVDGSSLFDGNIIVKGSSVLNEEVASFNQKLTIDPRKIFFVPYLSIGGYNAVAQQNDAGIFWTDGLASPGHNQSAGFVIGPWNGGTPSGIRIAHDGKIGIGKAIPIAKLDVNGNGYFSGPVSINTEMLTNPFPGNGYMLAVKGKVIAEEYVAKLTPWPDYVFKKDYKLKELNELEQFIKEKEHLPGIPTAKEAEKNGVSLGEMAKMQMEKIEELTLYMIQMNKEIQNLKAENKKLKSENK